MLKNCLWCDKVFDGRLGSRYCSKQCCGLAQRKVITLSCAYCNKTFSLLAHNYEKGRKYCSNRCADLANGKSKQHKRVAIICAICGKEFFALQLEIDKGKKYCSKLCHSKSMTKNICLVCLNCGRIFEPKRKVQNNKQKYCSRKCSGESRKRDMVLTCLVCHRDFLTKKKQVNKGRKYCSYECARIAVLSVHEEILTVCAKCGKDIRVSRIRFSKFEHLFCSKECRTNFMRGENAPYWLGGKNIERKCSYCGKSFIAWIGKSQKYCSRECHGKAKTLPDYMRKYPSAFGDDLTEEIRSRDSHECVMCGGEDVYRKLNVHHINYAKEDIRGVNLISLCKSCHGKTNHNRSYWQNHLSSLIGMLGY